MCLFSCGRIFILTVRSLSFVPEPPANVASTKARPAAKAGSPTSEGTGDDDDFMPHLTTPSRSKKPRDQMLHKCFANASQSHVSMRGGSSSSVLSVHAMLQSHPSRRNGNRSMQPFYVTISCVTVLELILIFRCSYWRVSIVNDIVLSLTVFITPVSNYLLLYQTSPLIKQWLIQF